MWNINPGMEPGKRKGNCVSIASSSSGICQFHFQFSYLCFLEAIHCKNKMALSQLAHQLECEKLGGKSHFCNENASVPSHHHIVV